MRAGSASAAALVHSRSEFVSNSVDQVSRRDVVPCGGTAFKIVSHDAGAPGVPGLPGLCPQADLCRVGGWMTRRGS